MDGYRRTCSNSSELTRDDTTPEFAPQDMFGKESASMEWTDEKHSLYLKSMETSFVNQLYNSMDLLGWCPKQDFYKPRSIQHLDNCTPSGEFKVLRDGCWETINFHRHGSTSTESHVHLKSPWIQHFRSSRKSQVVTSPARQQLSSSPVMEHTSGRSSPKFGAASCSKHSHSCQSYSRHHLVDDNAEVSDQNFVDEEDEEEHVTNGCKPKRMKTTAEASSSDQVVPYGKLPLIQD